MSQTSYDNVPLYTGIPVPQDNNGFFQPPAPSAEGILATDQARAVAEVQAALVIAASRPRNELRARDRLLQACQRVNLASGALYQYTRGGTSVSGPSIRLAEAAARAWGNMNYGFRELSRRPGESECEAFAWDLETNTKAVRQFSVRHRRDTRKGGYDLTDERDIYELMANQAQRRVRAAILEIIPGDIMEDAVAECEKTLKASVGDVADATAKLVQAFADMGVSREALEKRLGQRIDSLQPAQIIGFRKIYVSIKEGMSDARDWFELPSGEPSGDIAALTAPSPAEAVDVAPAAEAPETPPAAPAGDPAEDAAKETAARKKTRKTDTAGAGGTASPEAPPAAPSATQDEPAIPCPRKDGGLVSADDCFYCPERKGCPAREDSPSA